MRILAIRLMDALLLMLLTLLLFIPLLSLLSALVWLGSVLGQ